MTRARWACGADGRRTVWTATRDKCVCGGYSFPHRATGGACLHGARSDYHRAIRDGVSQLEALAELTVDQLERHSPF